MTHGTPTTPPQALAVAPCGDIIRLGDDGWSDSLRFITCPACVLAGLRGAFDMVDAHGNPIRLTKRLPSPLDPSPPSSPAV